jgi:Gpi18-like mannosyltransferase
MNSLLNRYSDISKIILLFLVWRIIILLVSFYSASLKLGSTDKFLGGGAIFFNSTPQFFSLANFDGEHYLSIAINGYRDLEQAFFPVYPAIINFFLKPFFSDYASNVVNAIVAGAFISNISFLLALIVLFKLIILDYSKKAAFLTVIILLVFPTSFYFSAIYNESFFLLLLLLSFYNARKRKWFLASVFGLIASATRLFGIFIFFALLIEVWKEKENLKRSFWIFFIPFGLIVYMIYQQIYFNDFLAFIHLQKIVGEQRASYFISLPQVYFRYIKMILSVDRANPIFQTIVFEAFSGILFFVLPIIGYFKKVRLSYLFFAFASFLITTVQGSFSSVPRYVIVFFPGFLVLALIFEKFDIKTKVILLLLSISALIYESSLFFRGYWIA